MCSARWLLLIVGLFAPLLPLAAESGDQLSDVVYCRLVPQVPPRWAGPNSIAASVLRADAGNLKLIFPVQRKRRLYGLQFRLVEP